MHVHRTLPDGPLSPGVLLFTPWYGGNEGGVAVVTEAIAHSVRERGAACVVVEVVGDGGLPRSRSGRAGETVVSLCVRAPESARTPVAKLGARARSAVAYTVLRRLAKRHRLHVAHFHYSLPVYGALADLCRHLGLPVVTTFHGSDLVANMHDAPTRAATARVLGTAAAVTTVSGALRRELLHWFPDAADRSSVIYNAVPPEFACPSSTPRGTARDVDVLFFGNLIPRKGVDVLLRAFRTVSRSRPTARLVVVGDGAERPALEALAHRLGIVGSVSFLGRRGRDEIFSLCGRARVVVVPSRAEPFGVVVLEAQSRGAAVVASAVGGIPEIIADGVTGVLVPPEDPQEIASAVLALLHDEPYRSALTAAAERHVFERFTPAVMAERYIELYRSALGTPTTGAVTPETAAGASKPAAAESTLAGRES